MLDDTRPPATLLLALASLPPWSPDRACCRWRSAPRVEQRQANHCGATTTNPTTLGGVFEHSSHYTSSSSSGQGAAEELYHPTKTSDCVASPATRRQSTFGHPVVIQHNHYAEGRRAQKVPADRLQLYRVGGHFNIGKGGKGLMTGLRCSAIRTSFTTGSRQRCGLSDRASLLQ